jgi:putative effector of murein hydrolase
VPAPVELQAVILTALLNPATVAVAFWMGRTADQWQKVPVAAFVGAVVGSALLYIAVRLGLSRSAGLDRAAAGVFIAQFVFGLAWACLGYRFGRSRP